MRLPLRKEVLRSVGGTMAWLGKGKSDLLSILSFLVEGDQEESLSRLRNAVIGGVENLPVDRIANLSERVKELFENPPAPAAKILGGLQPLHLLHQDRARPQRLGEPNHLEDQQPPLIPEAPPLANLGEGLTRRTTAEQLQLPWLQREFIPKLVWVDVANVSLDDLRAA